MPATKTTTTKAKSTTELPKRVKCARCQKRKPRSAFHANKANKRTGTQSYCKACAREIDGAKKSAA